MKLKLSLYYTISFLLDWVFNYFSAKYFNAKINSFFSVVFIIYISYKVADKRSNYISIMIYGLILDLYNFDQIGMHILLFLLIAFISEQIFIKISYNAMTCLILSVSLFIAYHVIYCIIIVLMYKISYKQFIRLDTLVTVFYVIPESLMTWLISSFFISWMQKDKKIFY